MRLVLLIGVVSAFFLFGAAPTAQAAPPASIEMTLPADASVWLDEQATTQTGTERHFASPSLEVGLHYSYMIRVRWTDGGKTLERSRRVRFESGDHIRINLAHGDEPTLEVTVARTAPAFVRVSPAVFAPESNPTIFQYKSVPYIAPGLNSGSLSGPPPAGFDRW